MKFFGLPTGHIVSRVACGDPTQVTHNDLLFTVHQFIDMTERIVKLEFQRAVGGTWFGRLFGVRARTIWVENHHNELHLDVSLTVIENVRSIFYTISF